MLKAKALCAVDGNTAPEIRPLISVAEKSAAVERENGSGLKAFIRNMQNFVCRWPVEVMERRNRLFPCFRIWQAWSAPSVTVRSFSL